MGYKKFNGAISVEFRDSIIRCETMGPSWGIPATMLRQYRRKTRSRSPYLEYEAKVARGSLLTRKIESFTINTEDPVSYQINRMNVSPYGSHSHVMHCIPTVIVGCLCHVLDEVRNESLWSEGDLTLKFAFGPFKCWECATDVYFHIRHEQTRSSPTRVRIISYQDFGNRNVPFESSQSAMFQPRIWAPEAWKAEALTRDLKQNWNEIEGKLSNPERVLSAAELRKSLSRISGLLSQTDIPVGEEYLLTSWFEWNNAIADALCDRLFLRLLRL